MPTGTPPLKDLCRRCDVFIGYGAIGVVMVPAGKDREWLYSHCWMCGRSREEIQQEQTGLATYRRTPATIPTTVAKAEAFHALRQSILAGANHELERVNQALREAGIDYPTGAAGVRDLADQRDTRGQAIIDMIQERHKELLMAAGTLPALIGEIIKLIEEDDKRYDD